MDMVQSLARMAFAKALLILALMTRRAAQTLVYLAGGALRIADLRAMTCAVWLRDDPPSFLGFEPWEVKTYETVVRPGSRLLIVGCGAGRDLLPFAGRGHEVVGVDPIGVHLSRLREILRERRQSAELIEGFIEDVQLPGSYDVIIFSPYCYGSIQARSHRVTTLSRLRQQLRPGGRVVLTYRQRTRTWSPIGTRLAASMAWLTHSDWRPEPYDVLSAIGQDVVQFEHWFSADEIEREANAASLVVQSHACVDWMPVMILAAGDRSRGD